MKLQPSGRMSKEECESTMDRLSEELKKNHKRIIRGSLLLQRSPESREAIEEVAGKCSFPADAAHTSTGFFHHLPVSRALQAAIPARRHC